MSDTQPIKDIDRLEASTIPHFVRNRVVLRAVSGRAAVHPLVSIHRDNFIESLKDIIANLDAVDRRQLQAPVLGSPAPGMRRVMTFVDISEALLSDPAGRATVADIAASDAAAAIRGRVAGDTIQA